METTERPVVLWDCRDDAEYLTHATKKEAIESYLDDIPMDQQDEKITAHGYARMIVPKPDEGDAAALVDEFFESHWEELIGEDGPDITDRMSEAALAFLTVLHEEFKPWACEIVTSEEINVADWIAENRPDWTEPPE